jgi:hypothetical protein
MVIALAAYVHGSVTTDAHEFDDGFALVLFVADIAVASSVVNLSELAGVI